MKEPKDDIELKRYLLGSLSESETAVVDIGLIENADFVEELIFAEEKLIEEFLEGELNKEEIALFEKNFLVSDSRKQQFELIADLKRYAMNLETDNAEVDSETFPKPNFFQSLTERLWSQPIGAVAAVIFVGLLGTLIWFSFFGGVNRTSALEAEYRALNAGDFSDVSKFRELKKLILISGKTRGENRSDEIIKKDLTDKLFVNIAIQSDADEKELFKLKVLQQEKVVFLQTKIQGYSTGFGRELRFLLPSEVFEQGTYELEIESVKNPANRLVRSFTIK